MEPKVLYLTNVVKSSWQHCIRRHIRLLTSKTMTKSNQSEKTTNPIEQFVLSAKNAQEDAAKELIRQVLESPGVYVFGELLDVPNIQALADGRNDAYFNTLHLFAYGTYKSYLENRAQFLDLSSNQQKKLQHLTVVTLATRLKCIPYSVLLQELDVRNVRDLEDLIIEAVYSDIIQGKLDQKNSQLEVDYAIGRDIKREDIGGVIKTLQDWCQSCEAVLSSIEEQVERANNEKTAFLLHREGVLEKILNIKKTIKAVETDDNMSVDREAPTVEKAKKMLKTKSKYYEKFWNNKP